MRYWCGTGCDVVLSRLFCENVRRHERSSDGSWRTAGRPSASRRHVDHSAWMMLRGPVWPGQRAPPPSRPDGTDVAVAHGSPVRLAAGGHDGPVDAGNTSAEQRLGTAAVARRSVGSAESQRANRAWWDADADDYQAEHGDVPRRRRLRLVPRGPARGRRAPARATSRGRRVLEVGCGSAPCARWLADPGRRGRSGVTSRPACCGTRAGQRPRPASPCRCVQADAERTALRRPRLRHRLLGLRRGARSWPTPAR